MKRTLKKLLVCILIVLMINNFFFNNISLADDGGFGEWLADMMGTVVGLLTWPIRMIALACAWAIDGVTRNVALSQGAVDEFGNIVEGTYYNIEMLTPFDIFFNRIAILDVNFFNVDTSNDIITTMRSSIAGWYYVMRTIAAAILLCVFIYVGIRMAITTIASDKAAYKKMLVDWICSLALIFLLQYIMLFTFAVNEAFIKGLSGVADAQSLCDAMVNIKKLSTGISVNSIAATIVFCMLTIQTIALLISYINRMLKIAFLVIIAPLITLTYSMDKMGDGKAQALTTWLKEFIYTVLLQTFHCIIYLAFVGMALSILSPDGGATISDDNNLAGVVLAILCIKFTKDAEKILGKIFDFSGSTSDSSLAVGMAASAMALSNAKGLGKGARNAFNGIKSAKGTIGNALRTSKVEAMALGAMLSGARNEDGSRKSFAENKADAEEKVTNAEADKLEKKNSEKYGVKTKGDSKEAKAYQDKIAKLTQANKDAGMSGSMAAAKARAQVAKETRESNIKNNPKGMKDKAKHLWKYNKVRGTINGIKNVASQSEVLRQFGNIGKMTMAAGLGTFVGSGSYGVSGNAFNAFSLGAATYKGSKEFMKNSTKTLTNDMSQLFKGAGYTDVADASSKINGIMQNSDTFEKADDRIDEIFKELEKALDGLSDREKKDLRSNIKNVVDGEMTRNPAATNSDIMQKLLGHSQISQQLGLKQGENGKVESTKAGVMDALMGKDDKTGLLDFKRNKVIYDKIKTAGDIGVSPDAFIQSAIQQYENDVLTFGPSVDTRAEKAERKAMIGEIESGDAISEEVQRKLNELSDSPEQRKAFEEAVEAEINNLEHQKDTLDKGAAYSPEVVQEAKDAIDEKIRRLEEQLQDVADKGSAKDMQRHKDEVDRLRDEIKRVVEAENAKLKEAEGKIGDEARKLEVERMELEAERKEYEALVKYTLEQHAVAAKEASNYGTTGEAASRAHEDLVKNRKY